MTLLVVLIIVAILVIAAIAIYNKLVRLRNTVKSSWSDIDVQCKERYGLVPNLVETVKAMLPMRRPSSRRSPRQGPWPCRQALRWRWPRPKTC